MGTFSSAVTPPVHLRIPTWMRIYGTVFSVLWFGMLVVMIVVIVSSGEPAAAIMPVGMGVFGVLVIGRVFRIGVRSSGDNLLVRNNFSTRTLQRSEIEGFRHGEWISPFHLVIFATTRDEILPLHVTMHTPFFGKRRARDQLAGLRAWHGVGAS